MSVEGRNKNRPAPLLPGEYRLRLLLLDPNSTAPGQRVFTVSLNNSSGEEYWTFDPVKAGYLRLVCHGTSENDWNSICEVRIESLASGGSAPRVTASAAVAGYPAEYAIDGTVATRWAVRGSNHWIQFRLDCASNDQTHRYRVVYGRQTAGQL